MAHLESTGSNKNRSDKNTIGLSSIKQSSSGTGSGLDEDSNEVKKVWSAFENCIVLSTELLLNRHLDQILLSAIYLVGKVSSQLNANVHSLILIFLVFLENFN